MPTSPFPQIYIDGELVGGCDITVEMLQNGELVPAVKAAVAKYKAASNSEAGNDEASPNA